MLKKLSVSIDNKGYYSLSYGNITPLLVEAFKEQNVKIENQQQIIEEQKKDMIKQKEEIQELKTRLTVIEKLLLAK